MLTKNTEPNRLKRLKPGQKTLPPIKPKATNEHPDDYADRGKTEKYARVLIDEFFAARRVEFMSVVALWSDAEAEEAFNTLRREFWGNGEVYDAMKEMEKEEARNV